MQFSAAFVAIFASVALAAGPGMPAAAADAIPTGPADAVPTEPAGTAGMPQIPPELAACAEKCASKAEDPNEAIACLKKECADAISSLKSAAMAAATGAARGPSDADAAAAAGAPM
ncbi:hypothetical protein PWT90_09634 [Aphanocladium album]|nr:hypothetical protein PWT90_09634 [Aphanocladium album]